MIITKLNSVGIPLLPVSGGCHAKFRFPSQIEAMLMAGQHNAANLTGRRARVYRCPGCGGYHITSKTEWRRP